MDNQPLIYTKKKYDDSSSSCVEDDETSQREAVRETN